MDNGLLKISSVDDKGRLLENLVFVEILRQNKEIAYYRDTNKNEVDFIIKEGKKVQQLIQVCYDLSNFQTKDREIRSLVLASNVLNCGDLLILSGSQESEETFAGKKIKVIPVWKWILEAG